MRWIAAVVLCVALALRADIGLSQSLEPSIRAEAEELVREGRAEEAWRLLAPLERQHAGEVEFDLLLGVAALESGRANRATFIFERVLTANPAHVAARLEMARAYFALRDFERAEREFSFILESAPPPEIRALSEAYLATMRAPSAPARTGLTGYVEASLGRDSNVAAASAQSSVFIPGLGAEFVPDPLFQRRPDDFVALGAGFEYTHALRADLGLVVGADVLQRWHSDVDEFDVRSDQVQAALIHRRDERTQLQYSLQHQRYQLDNTPYREAQSLGGQWSRAFTRRSRIAAFALGHRLRYKRDDARASSSNLAIAGASLTQVLEEATATTATAGFYVGYDNAVAGRADGDRRILAASLHLQRLLRPGLEGYLRFSLLDSSYRTPNVDFGVVRGDQQRDAVLGLAWEFAGGWWLRPQLARTVNRSNLPLNEYSRTETSITLRRQFD
jgi:outer membrane protein